MINRACAEMSNVVLRKTYGVLDIDFIDGLKLLRYSAK